MSSNMLQNNNTKACAVYLFYIDPETLAKKWFGAVAWRNPRDFDFTGFDPESPIDQEKTSTFAFGAFGGRRENQTIFDCAYEETVQECGYCELPRLREKLENAPYLCRDLKGNITRKYSPNIEYACITFFVAIPYIQDPISLCEKSAIKTYQLQLSDCPSHYDEKHLEKYKRQVESISFQAVDLEDVLNKLKRNILPIIDVSDRKRIDPEGFPEAARRVGKGLDLRFIPLMPRAAKTLLSVDFWDEIFTMEVWSKSLSNIMSKYFGILGSVRFNIPSTYQESFERLESEICRLGKRKDELLKEMKSQAFGNVMSPLTSLSSLMKEHTFNAETIKGLYDLTLKGLKSLHKEQRLTDTKYERIKANLKLLELPTSFDELESFKYEITTLRDTFSEIDHSLKDVIDGIQKFRPLFNILGSIEPGDSKMNILLALQEYGYSPLVLPPEKFTETSKTPAVLKPGIDKIRDTWPIEVTCPQCKSLIRLDRKDVYAVPRCSTGGYELGPYSAVFDCPYRNKLGNLCNKQISVPEHLLRGLKIGLPEKEFPCEEEFRNPVAYRRKQERIAQKNEDDFFNH